MLRPLAALAAAAAFLAVLSLGGLRAPRPAAAFTIAGPALDVDARHFRVAPATFLDAAAHDNVVPHPNFPGATGVTLAIRKAHAEWSSVPFAGDGLGDGLQSNAVLGDAGSNLDTWFAGELASVAPSDANVHLAAPCDGGLLAYVASLPGGGWRVVYCDEFVWDDGPGRPDAGAVDLQAVATREIGRVLGLGNSSVVGSTMYPVASGDATSARSIEADDRAGLAALYGVRSLAKPRIDGASAGAAAGATLTLTGAHFAPTGNAVRFTGVGGLPAIVTGVPSSAGGTRLEVVVPPDARAGDVVVRVPGGGPDRLSNAWPLAVDAPPGAFALTGPGLGGLAGEVPLLSGAGDLSPGSASGFTLFLQLVRPSAPGVLFLGAGEGDLPFKGGVFDPLPLLAEVPLVVGGDGALALATAVPATIPGGASLVLQAWFLDAAGPFGVSGSNGLRLDVP